jgi:pilus assembly protein CpaE
MPSGRRTAGADRSDYRRAAVTEGVLLWVTEAASADRAVLGEATREFALALRCCAFAEAGDALRASLVVAIGVELDTERDHALALLRSLHERLPDMPIVAASRDASVATIREAFEAGAGEIVSLPLSRTEIAKVLVKLTQTRRRPTARQESGAIVTLYAPRGGLGVTTLAVNLAVRMRALTQHEVALLDLDLQRGDVTAFLNLTPLQTLATLAAAEGGADASFLEGTLTRHASGIHVLGAPTHIEEADSIEHEHIALALRLLRARFAYTIVDTARVITAATVAALEYADRILMLTDLSVPGVRAAQRTVDLLRALGTSVSPDLVIAETAGSPVGLKDAVRTIGVEPLLVLPHDAVAVRTAMNAGTPLNGSTQSRLALAIAELAARLSGNNLGERRRGRFLRRIFAKEAASWH